MNDYVHNTTAVTNQTLTTTVWGLCFMVYGL